MVRVEQSLPTSAFSNVRPPDNIQKRHCVVHACRHSSASIPNHYNHYSLQRRSTQATPRPSVDTEEIAAVGSCSAWRCSPDPADVLISRLREPLTPRPPAVDDVRATHPRRRRCAGGWGSGAGRATADPGQRAAVPAPSPVPTVRSAAARPSPRPCPWLSGAGRAWSPSGYGPASSRKCRARSVTRPARCAFHGDELGPGRRQLG